MKILLPALPVILGFLLDCAVGDPYNIPHPIKLIGRLIGTLEKLVRKRMKNLRLGGVILGMTVILLSTAVPLALLLVCYHFSLIVGIVAETVLCCYMLAARCLCRESMKVCRAAESGDTEAARKAVSMIVGRDTAVLDRDGIIRAAVETVAENTSDGVTAPLFYMGLGGAVGAFFYKSVNTMDSMIGYKDKKFADIGRFAAKLDDVLNYIPSRLTAFLMVIAAPISGLDGRNAFSIWRRDRRNHASPNSAQTESTCAGALGIRLGGLSYYGGVAVDKPYLGDDLRQIENKDIIRAGRLMFLSEALTLFICLAILSLIILW